MRLTDEQRLLRDTARDFARNELAPHAAEWDREARFPKEALAELGKLGFMGMLVPPEYGGAGRRPCRLCAGDRGDRRRRRRGLDDPQRAQFGRLHAGAALRLARSRNSAS